MLYILCIIAAYLLGGVPMGLILTKLAGRGDLRKIGSGNIGAANAMRAGGLRIAVLTWALDMAKTIIAVAIGCAAFDTAFGAWCGCAAVIGHCFPIWLRFRGGKGISALFGVALAINPIIFVFCGIEWLVVALTSGFASLASLVAACALPIFGFAIGTDIGLACLAICAVCVLRHHENIARLVRGDESRLQWKWKK